MADLIVVACHGPDWIGQCRQSLKQHCPNVNMLFVDTSGTVEFGADIAIRGGHPTGALRWVLEQFAGYDRFLLMQDSMTPLTDPLPWFRDQLPEQGGAVAWARFPMQWDEGQQTIVESWYPGVPAPSHGIFGPVFYATRRSLDYLAQLDLLPPIPTTRLEAQGTERAWAYAFAAAGMPVVGPEWNYELMRSPEGFGPFRKVWARRP